MSRTVPSLPASPHRARLLACVMVATMPVFPPCLAHAANLVVNVDAHGVDVVPGDGVCATAGGLCTLRAAIQEANALPGTDVVALPAGTYVLTIPGVDDAAASGDLDVSSTITVTGAGAATTVIDGNAVDRLFEVSGAGVLTLVDLTIQNGNAGTSPASHGGGMSLGAGTTTTLSRVTVRDNRATLGGGIWATGDAELPATVLAIEDSSILGNTATQGSGGGIRLEHRATVTVLRTTISGNLAVTGGGGISLEAVTPAIPASLLLEDSTVADNVAPQGGGAWIYGDSGLFADHAATVTINRAAIVRNVATKAYGGGLFTWETVLTIANTTISGNTAASEGGGMVLRGGPHRVTSSTLTANSAFHGDNLATSSGTLLVKNTIIVGTRANENCYTLSGTLQSLGHNVEFPGTSCRFNTNPDDLGTKDPLLGPLANNGGPTQSHALMAGSPAIDAGENFACGAAPVAGVDQRGVQRPVAVRCDIGSYEWNQTGFTDDPLLSGLTPIRRAHITELRARIDTQRVRFGLPPAAWSASVQAGAFVRAGHVQELRDALVAAYDAANAGGAAVTVPVFADSPLVPGQTLIKVVHIQELRAAVVTLEGS